MKKLLLIMVVLLAFGSFAFAEELTLSGSVSFSLGDSDLSDGVTTLFSSASEGSVASFAIGTANDTVEAGVTISLLPTITKTSGTTAMLDAAEGTISYDAIGAAMDWYYVNMQGKTYKDEAGVTQTWPVIDFKATADATLTGVVTGTTTTGWSLTALGDLTASTTLSDSLNTIYTDITAKVETEINNMSSWLADGTVLILESDSAAVQAAKDAEADMYGDYYAYVYGSDTSDSWAASYPVKKAFLKLNALGGVLDLTFEVGGKAVGVGSMVTSENTSGDANLGITLGLASGVVDGVSASLLFTAADGSGAVSEDYEDVTVNADDASAPVYGFALSGGYSTDMFGVSLYFGATDVQDFAGTGMFSLAPSVSLADVAGLSLSGEFNYLLAGGMGAGASLGASIMGISPSLSFYYKDASYGGDGTTSGLDGSDLIDTDSMMEEFDSTDGAATALSFGVSVDLSELAGVALTLGGGYDMVLGGDSGYNASLGFDFADVLSAPLTLSASLGAFAGATLSWDFGLGYTVAELMSVTASLASDEGTLGYSLGAKVKF